MSFTTNGGEYYHTLNINEMPNHNHVVPAQEDTASTIQARNHIMGYNENKKSNYWYTDTTYAGGSKAHNNIQPYTITYFWRRVS